MGLLARAFSSFSKTIPIHVSKLPIDTTKLHLINQKVHGELGPIYAEKLGPDVNALWIACPKITEKLFRNEPEHPIHVVPQCWQEFNKRFNVKRGLFFLDGPEWQEMRSKMNPIFLKKNQWLAEALSHSNKVTDTLINDLKGQTEVDLEQILHKWSVESTLATLYGNCCQSTDSLNSFVQNVHQMFSSSAKLQTQSAFLAAETQTQDWLNFCSAAQEALAFLNSNLTKESKGLTGGVLSNVFTNEEISRIAQDLIIAAADTTSYTLLWALYHMATNKSWQEGEIKHKEVIRESMRISPVAPFLTRIQQKPLEAEEYFIDEGQLILVSIYAMGHDNSCFPNPEQFDPRRWSRDPESGKLKGVNDAFASLPFGFGTRSCIGKRLAEQQMEYFLNKFFATFELDVLNRVQYEMKLIGVPDARINFKLIQKKK
uniref:Cholesterol side-chain cleavage enzyme, mitochondrial n=1 Tax=Paracyclopina nana TaxID=565004 RepID=A0A0F7J1U8_PARNA|nr:cytochrome P450 315A1 [Paracyclopina nana]